MSTTYELPSVTWCDAQNADHYINVSALMQPHLNSGLLQITTDIFSRITREFSVYWIVNYKNISLKEGYLVGT
jgi:hypothetical protein